MQKDNNNITEVTVLILVKQHLKNLMIIIIVYIMVNSWGYHLKTKNVDSIKFLCCWFMDKETIVNIHPRL